jgi:hypothetical protein
MTVAAWQCKACDEIRLRRLSLGNERGEEKEESELRNGGDSR